MMMEPNIIITLEEYERLKAKEKALEYKLGKGEVYRKGYFPGHGYYGDHITVWQASDAFKELKETYEWAIEKAEKMEKEYAELKRKTKKWWWQ